jgi:uncharacterized protein (DUF433 family)
MRHWENLDAIEREPSKMSGAWVFRKTRVPVSALFENLRDGATVEDFLEWFPPVQRSQVEAVLNYELDMLAVQNITFLTSRWMGNSINKNGNIPFFKIIFRKITIQ